MPNPYITPQTFKFLKQLAVHNDRDWFNANKQRYLDEVRDPLLQLVSDFGPRLQKINKNLVADPRPVGGSLFRIYRDTRFSKDKTPYKTNAAISFRHVDGKDAHAPGYYLQIEPGNVFMGCGIWHAQPEAVKDVRDAIVAHPARWKRVLAKKSCALDDSEDTLKRPPRGYDPEHTYVEDLKRKSFTSSTNFTQQQAFADDFLTQLAKACRQKSPLMEFLCNALDRPW